MFRSASVAFQRISKRVRDYFDCGLVAADTRRILKLVRDNFDCGLVAAESRPSVEEIFVLATFEYRGSWFAVVESWVPVNKESSGFGVIGITQKDESLGRIVTMMNLGGSLLVFTELGNLYVCVNPWNSVTYPAHSSIEISPDVLLSRAIDSAVNFIDCVWDKVVTFTDVRGFKWLYSLDGNFPIVTDILALMPLSRGSVYRLTMHTGPDGCRILEYHDGYFFGLSAGIFFSYIDDGNLFRVPQFQPIPRTSPAVYWQIIFPEDHVHNQNIVTISEGAGVYFLMSERSPLDMPGGRFLELADVCDVHHVRSGIYMMITGGKCVYRNCKTAVYSEVPELRGLKPLRGFSTSYCDSVFVDPITSLVTIEYHMSELETRYELSSEHREGYKFFTFPQPIKTLGMGARDIKKATRKSDCEHSGNTSITESGITEQHSNL